MARPLPPDLRVAIDETTGLDLADQELHAYSFDGLHLHDTRFTRSDLTEASFRNANVSGARFFHALIAQGSFDTSRIHKTDFDYATLTAASFLDARISRTGFAHADLREADFARASLLKVSFKAARLHATSLRDAVLKLVSFEAMDLSGLDVTGARFDDVMFEEVTGLEGMRAEWILVGDDQFHERLEGAQARAWLREAAECTISTTSRWSSAGQDWRCEPELVPAGQRQLTALLARQADAPFAGMRLTRAAVEWLIARRPSTQEALDLRGADLRGMYLEGLPLQGLIGGLTATRWAMATPAERERCTARCAGTSFQGAHLEDALLVGVDCTQAGLSAHLDRANLSHALLRDAKAHRISAQAACFDHAIADGMDAASADLRRSTWRHASLVGVCFDGAKLDGADLRGADLRDATFSGASSVGTLFSEEAT